MKNTYMVTRSVKKNRLLWPSDLAWSAQRGSYFRCRSVRQYFRWTKTASRTPRKPQPHHPINAFLTLEIGGVQAHRPTNPNKKIGSSRSWLEELNGKSHAGSFYHVPLPLFALSSPTGFCWQSLRCQFAQTKKAHVWRRGMKLQPCGCLYHTRSSCTRWWLQDVGIRKGKPLRRGAATRDYCPRACVRACLCASQQLSLLLLVSSKP
jgi:hypothetical protein